MSIWQRIRDNRFTHILALVTQLTLMVIYRFGQSKMVLSLVGIIFFYWALVSWLKLMDHVHKLADRKYQQQLADRKRLMAEFNRRPMGERLMALSEPSKVATILSGQIHLGIIQLLFSLYLIFSVGMVFLFKPILRFSGGSALTFAGLFILTLYVLRNLYQVVRTFLDYRSWEKISPQVLEDSRRELWEGIEGIMNKTQNFNTRMLDGAAKSSIKDAMDSIEKFVGESGVLKR